MKSIRRRCRGRTEHDEIPRIADDLVVIIPTNYSWRNDVANVEKISVSMTPQHAEILRDAVESGAYASSSEVIREAMRDWSAKWVQRRDDIAKLRALWTEGKASGSSTEVDFDDTLSEARAELASLKNRDH